MTSPGVRTASNTSQATSPDAPDTNHFATSSGLELFTQSAAREVGETGEVPQVVGQGSDHRFQIRPLEEALPGVVLAQHPHLRDGRQQLTVVGETQGPTKKLQLPVDGRVRLLLLPAVQTGLP